MLNKSMEDFTEKHEDVNNNFDSLQEKFKMSMDNFSANLYLYPSYSQKFNRTFENLIDSTNNLYDSTTEVITNINDENIINHAINDTLNKIEINKGKLNRIDKKIELFYEISIVLDDTTKQLCDISKKYSVYSELNYHLYPEKVNEIHLMKPIFPDIEDLKYLKGPIIGIENNDNYKDIVCVCYDGINHPEITPIWFKFDINENKWYWSPFDPFCDEWDMFGHEWINCDTTSIEGDIGGETFDGSKPADVNVNIIEYLFDHNPVPTLT